MKKKRPAPKTRRRIEREVLSAAVLSACATKRFADQTRSLLGTHYANKHGVRRGR